MSSRLHISSLFRFFICIVASLFLVHCANEKAPEGGKKDTKPPKPKKIIPANKSLHFTGNKIEITFDEFIKPTGFSQTVVSPPLNKKPDFKISGKTLTIQFKSPLRDSTTYTINFAEDIKDVNEGNILNNFTYVFSTGDFIDSQKVSGKVYQAKDNSSADETIVELYPEDSILAIKHSKPFYFAKTDKSGSFKIENVKAGKYRILALKDQNYNYIYDQPNEAIAFCDTFINLHDSVAPKVELYIFKEQPKKISASASAVAPGHIEITLSSPYQTLQVRTLPKPEVDFWYPGIAKDTVTYWYSNYSAKRDTMFITINDTLRDTTRIELKNISIDSINNRKKYGLIILNQSDAQASKTNKKQDVNALELYSPLKITFNRPVVRIIENKAFQIFEDTLKQAVPYTINLDDSTKLFANLNFQKKESTTYTINIPDSVFQDIFGLWNKSLVYKAKTSTADNYGNLNITVKAIDSIAGVKKNYIIKLLNANNQLIRQLVFHDGEKEMKLTVPNLPAGSYHFTGILDENNNGEWDTGDFMKQKQPEKFINFPNNYNLKGGWDLEAEIKL
jgi:uncharacterized protein (DUF2141 family)